MEFSNLYNTNNQFHDNNGSKKESEGNNNCLF